MARYFLFVLPYAFSPFSNNLCALESSLYGLHHLVFYPLAFSWVYAMGAGGHLMEAKIEKTMLM